MYGVSQKTFFLLDTLRLTLSYYVFSTKILQTLSNRGSSGIL